MEKQEKKADPEAGKSSFYARKAGYLQKKLLKIAKMVIF